MGNDCNGDPFTLDPEIVRRCVLLNRCASFGFSVSECVSSWPSFMSFHLSNRGTSRQPSQLWQLLPCVDAPLATCDDVAACILPDPEASNSQGQTNAETYCDGAVAHTYRQGEEPRSVTIDCAAHGLACRVNRYTSYYAACVTPDLPFDICDGSKDGVRCEGNVETYCNKQGERYGFDCSKLGLGCGTGEIDSVVDANWIDCAPGGCRHYYGNADECDGDDLILKFGLYEGGARVPGGCAE